MIEATFPSVKNAYDLPMGEFLDRIRQAYEVIERMSDRPVPPEEYHLREIEKMATKAEKGRRFAK